MEVLRGRYNLKVNPRKQHILLAPSFVTHVRRKDISQVVVQGREKETIKWCSSMKTMNYKPFWI